MSLEEGLQHYPRLSYLHIPMHELPGRLDEISADREILVFCRTTSRSAIVYAFLRLQGFRKVRLVDGGYVALVKELVKRHGIF